MSLFLAIPCAQKNISIVGGQVTAARGLISYLDDKKIAYTLADTAAFISGNSSLVRFYIKVRTFVSVLFVGFRGKHKAALFFKSTFAGLPERSIQALVFRLRGARAALFFRNSDILALNPRTLRAFFTFWLLKPFSVYFVQGEQWRQHLVDLGFKSENIIIIPNWLPAGFSVVSQPKQPDDKLLRFVFTGRIVREKGVFDLLRALSISKLDGRCRCVFAGDGPDLSACKSMVADLGLKNVIFTGSLCSSDVRKLLIKADVFVLPTYHPEGFPNSVLEAMAVGLPVIATDVGAIIESVQHEKNGLIIPVRDASELSLAMKRYVDNPEVIRHQSAFSLHTIAKRHNREVNCALLIDALLDS